MYDSSNLGTRLRNLRLENELTQEELANRSELTKGYISQLENNLASPSISTLEDILEVLGSSLSEFFANDDENQEKVVYQKDEFFEKEDDDLMHKIEWLVPNSLKYEMEPILITLKPGGKSDFDEPHPGEEFGYVLDGEITLKLGNKHYKVKKGESFYYPASKSHQIENNTNKVALVIWISTPPMF